MNELFLNIPKSIWSLYIFLIFTQIISMVREHIQVCLSGFEVKAEALAFMCKTN